MLSGQVNVCVAKCSEFAQVLCQRGGREVVASDDQQSWSRSKRKVGYATQRHNSYLHFAGTQRLRYLAYVPR